LDSWPKNHGPAGTKDQMNRNTLPSGRVSFGPLLLTLHGCGATRSPGQDSGPVVEADGTVPDFGGGPDATGEDGADASTDVAVNPDATSSQGDSAPTADDADVAVADAGTGDSGDSGLGAKIYYVAPTGTASNDGTSFATALDLATALRRIAAGETILLQAGTYAIPFQAGVSNTMTLSKAGTADKPLRVFAESDQIAVIDFGCPDNTFVDQSVGFMVSGSYWHMKGITVTRAPYQGVYVTGAHNTLEN
jgi:hypothetical protein